MSRPHVTLKLATSLDGKIATQSGESRWITGEEARAEVQRLRAASDAVMVGAETARTDDPELLARTDPPPDRQPLRVVIASDFAVPARGRLFGSLDRAPVLVIGRMDTPETPRSVLIAAGARTAAVPQGAHGGVNLSAALDMLGLEWGVQHVLVEGGGRLAASLISAGLVDRLEWFRAPIVLGAEGRPGVADLALGALKDAPAFRRVAVRALGPDLWESYERT